MYSSATSDLGRPGSTPGTAAAGRGRRPAVSVVVPCHGDAAEVLYEQLRALAAQDVGEPWEVLLADNGASPATLAVAESFRTTIPDLRVVDAREHPGQAYAVNTAVRAARGEHLLLLDSDDVVAPDYVRLLSAALRDHVFAGARLDADTLNPGWLRARRRPMQSEGLEVVLDAGQPVVIGAAMAVRRSAFEAVGGFDETMDTQIDLDLSWRLQAAGHVPAFVRNAVVQYRYRSELSSLWRQERAYGIGEARLYAKHRRSGLPRRPLRRTVHAWAQVLTAVPGAAVSRSGRARLVTRAGAAQGRLVGSIRERTLYL
jgi:cellulose synthase/poly-beta-1,6-N-acetylglucosamine synthase-like glycosyltransferase